MQWSSEVERRLSRADRPADPDVVLELAQHAQAAYEAARADGLAAEAATERVRQYLDHWCADPRPLHRRPARTPAVQAPAMAARGWTGGLHDVMYGIRLLRRQP